ncbi:ATPase/GTPase, AAA15 family [Dethiosulfatibacter aminovorans DSM 17477]|uniref:ATPase/GTPase, AAA15 family n=1 Tax=Dethiosulfatibacter aminovorans DSM 17477 TaxID=1121476 RepID=A0A1M6LCU2_9FIRM|nr:ATP-binding protein [Dethiosulfatibacter aminovorans]SHJ68978.1 ATPase/GTPase, AAA15 family [Dethiosulfatibacter aminovorans DSM 17477]
MIQNIKLSNFGVIEELEWNNLGKINVIVGENGSGKTFLLKSLYASLKTIEVYRRGNEMKKDSELLVDKLHWTYQVNKIGDLVMKGADNPLKYEMKFNNREFEFSFGKSATKNITRIRNNVDIRKENSIFLPAKEVLSLYDVILESRENDRLFGFDDTYYDLVKALKIPKSKGKNYKEFAKSREMLDKIIDGRVEFDSVDNNWYFKRGNQKFSIHSTAEGIKKISILDHLLGNRYLDKESVIFIDEPEAAIHPKAISQFMEILKVLTDNQIQVFIATHSYFVLKKLHIIAKREDISIPIISLDNEGNSFTSDLQIEMPDNEIVNESIRIYEEEIEADY